MYLDQLPSLGEKGIPTLPPSNAYTLICVKQYLLSLFKSISIGGGFLVTTIEMHWTERCRCQTWFCFVSNAVSPSLFLLFPHQKSPSSPTWGSPSTYQNLEPWYWFILLHLHSSSYVNIPIKVQYKCGVESVSSITPVTPLTIYLSLILSYFSIYILLYM